MVYLERLENRDKKIVDSITWKREKQIKKWTRTRKKKLIQMNHRKTTELMRKYMI